MSIDQEKEIERLNSINELKWRKLSYALGLVFAYNEDICSICKHIGRNSCLGCNFDFNETSVGYPDEIKRHAESLKKK